MKPVAIIRHARSEEPGHFATFLEANGVAWQLIAVDRSEPIPATSKAYSGIAMMGGPMSVNDELPWIAHECALIRDAVDRGVPLIGHCLGAQMISRALGGTVGASPAPEIGWHEITVADNDLAQRWFGFRGERCTVFQWHGEMFSLPPGATPIAASDWCPQQAFVIGPHLAMQFHVEMTHELVGQWCADWQESFDPGRHRLASIQSAAEILDGCDSCLAPMRRLADRLYSCWLAGLRR
jgi:GMP synthase-like glutamine amidotransferase